MDLHKAILELYEEREQIDAVIASLEEYIRVNVEGLQRSRRGRKSMSPTERLEVSARMRSYWAERRRNRGAAAAAP